jgi:hypothetical protein
MLSRRVLQESARAEESEETHFRLLAWRKALKSETQERWRLKEISQGFECESRQVGSQTQKADLPRDRAKSFGRFEKSVKNASGSENAEGSNAL